MIREVALNTARQSLKEHIESNQDYLVRLLVSAIKEHENDDVETRISAGMIAYSSELLHISLGAMLHTMEKLGVIEFED